MKHIIRISIGAAIWGILLSIIMFQAMQVIIFALLTLVGSYVLGAAILELWKISRE